MGAGSAKFYRLPSDLENTRKVLTLSNTICLNNFFASHGKKAIEKKMEIF